MKYPLHKNETGSFQELIHASDVEFGQLSLLTVVPRRLRGGHYHKRKTEWFCCIRGECCLVIADIRGEQHECFVLKGDDKEFTVVKPDSVHTVLNATDRECELLIIADEEYNSEDADTYIKEH